MPSRRVTGKRPLVPPEVPLDHGDPSGHDRGHHEAAGVWTDDEGPAVRFLGHQAPRLMAYKALEYHPEPHEVPLDHGDPSGHVWNDMTVAGRAPRPLSEPERRAEELATSYLKAGIMSTGLVLQLFETLEEVQQLFSRAGRRKPKGKATSWATGAFTHGGVSGLRNGARRLPNVSRFLARFARDVMGATQFAAIATQRNGGGQAHCDFHNLPGSRNWLCPLTSFEGGGLWTQLEHGEDFNDDESIVVREVKPGCELKGKIIKAAKGKAFSFDPRKWHEVQPHEGDRVMFIAYTPRLSNLDPGHAEYLKGLGFRPYGEEEGVLEPEDQGAVSQPDKRVLVDNGGSCEASLIMLNEAHHQLLEDLQERSRSLRLLMEEEHMLAEDLRQTGKLVEEEAEKVQFSITQMLRQASQRLSRQD